MRIRSVLLVGFLSSVLLGGPLGFRQANASHISCYADGNYFAGYYILQPRDPAGNSYRGASAYVSVRNARTCDTYPLGGGIVQYRLDYDLGTKTGNHRGAGFRSVWLFPF